MAALQPMIGLLSVTALLLLDLRDRSRQPQGRPATKVVAEETVAVLSG